MVLALYVASAGSRCTCKLLLQAPMTTYMPNHDAHFFSFRLLLKDVRTETLYCMGRALPIRLIGVVDQAGGLVADLGRLEHGEVVHPRKARFHPSSQT